MSRDEPRCLNNYVTIVMLGRSEIAQQLEYPQFDLVT